MNQSLTRRDRLGRIRFTREQRNALLDAYEGSSLTGPQFATLHGVAYQTFATWAQKRRKQVLSAAFPLTLTEVEHSPDSVPEARPRTGSAPAKANQSGKPPDTQARQEESKGASDHAYVETTFPPRWYQRRD